MRIWIPGKPPTATAQQKGQNRQTGVWYKPAKLKAAEDYYLWGLKAHKPRVPFGGAVRLDVIFFFPSNKSHKDGELKTTRPDNDNSVKLLKDCMTRLGFWMDDAQVTTDFIRKFYSDKPGVLIEVREDEP